MIYLDNAATTAMFPECVDIIKKYAVDEYFNPSALYAPAITAAKAVKEARGQLAKALGCSADNMVFTASGSEADNFALVCGPRKKKGRIIISAVEHAAVFNCAKALADKGYELCVAPCDNYGRVNKEEFLKLLNDDVVLVSIMHVCNETGALNDIEQLCAEVRKRCKDAIFHSDGVQAFCKIPFSVKDLGVDLYSVSGHKIHAPKGIGALYIRSGLNLQPFIYGGGQEKNLRSGTENVAEICAFGYAAERMSAETEKNFRKQKELQKRLIDGLTETFSDTVKINTDINESGAHIVSFSFNGIRGEVMLHFLESKGIIVGTGSACSSKKAAERIPNALGLSGAFREGTLRISLNERISEEDIDALLCALKDGAKLLGKYRRV